MSDLAGRVLVVDDSAFMRIALRRIIEAEPGMQVVGVASDGAEAVAMNRSLRPDIITMDIEMNGVNGLDAMRTILALDHAPIVIVVSNVTQDGTAATAKALALGAADWVSKSSEIARQDLGQVDLQLRAKLRFWASQPRPPPARSQPARPGCAVVRPALGRIDLIVVAASTGGPKVLGPFLAAAGRLSAPMVIAQHMPARYTSSLAELLRAELGLDVVEGAHKMPLRRGRVAILPGGIDGVVAPCAPGGGEEFELRLVTTDATVHPNADLLFSAAAVVARNPVAVILTGMGMDGTAGAAKIHGRGCPVLVQDPATCIVDGMPSAAIAAGVVTDTLGVEAIGFRLAAWAGPS